MSGISVVRASSTIANGSVTDAKLASPNNSVYRVLMVGASALSTSAASGTTYFFGGESGLLSTLGVGSGASSTHPSRNLVATDYAVAGLTTKLFLRATVITNSVAPTITITPGLYPLTSSGNNFVLGTVVSGSTAAVTTPGANALTSASSGDFSFPTDGPYAFGVIVSGTPSGAMAVTATLMVRNV